MLHTCLRWLASSDATWTNSNCSFLQRLHRSFHFDISGDVRACCSSGAIKKAESGDRDWRWATLLPRFERLLLDSVYLFPKEQMILEIEITKSSFRIERLIDPLPRIGTCSYARGYYLVVNTTLRECAEPWLLDFPRMCAFHSSEDDYAAISPTPAYYAPRSHNAYISLYTRLLNRWYFRPESMSCLFSIQLNSTNISH